MEVALLSDVIAPRRAGVAPSIVAPRRAGGAIYRSLPIDRVVDSDTRASADCATTAIHSVKLICLDNLDRSALPLVTISLML